MKSTCYEYTLYVIICLPFSFPCSDILPIILFTSKLNLCSHVRIRSFLALYRRTDTTVPLATVFTQYSHIRGPSNSSTEHRNIQTTGNNVCTHVSTVDKCRVTADQHLSPLSELDNLKLCNTLPVNSYTSALIF
jgi:hypothetical protein